MLDFQFCSRCEKVLLCYLLAMSLRANMVFFSKNNQNNMDIHTARLL